MDPDPDLDPNEFGFDSDDEMDLDSDDDDDDDNDDDPTRPRRRRRPNPLADLPPTIPRGVFERSGAYVDTWGESSMARSGAVDPAVLLDPSFGSFTAPWRALSAAEFAAAAETRRRWAAEADTRVCDLDTGLMFESEEAMRAWKEARKG